MAALTERKNGRATATRREAPDLMYLTGFKSWAETTYAEDNARIDLMRKVREMDDLPVLPEDLCVDGIDSAIQDPTITDEIARVTATLSMREPFWTITPPDPETDRSEINSELREAAMKEIFRFCGTRSPGLSTFHALVDACVGDGGAVSKWVYNPERWESVYHLGKDPKTTDKEYENAKKRAGIPLSRIPVDVRTWNPMWEGDRLCEVMEICERPFFPTLRKYGLSYNERDGFGQGLGHPMSPDEARRYPATIEFWEHWDDTWVSYCARTANHEKMLLQFEHGLGRVPYFYAPGLTMNHWRGRKCGVGVGYNKLALCRFRSYLLTLMIHAVARVSSASLVHEYGPGGAESVQGEDDAPFAPIPMPLAKILRIENGEKLTPLALPGIPDATKEMLAVTTRLIDELNSPRTNPNVGGDLAGAGYAIQSVLTEGKTRHHPFIASLERMHEEETYFVWDLIVRKVKEKIWVRRSIDQGKPAEPGMQWMGIGPEDVDEAVGVRVTLDPEPATSKIVEERYVGELLDRGLISNDQAIAYLGFNPHEVRVGKQMDRIRNESFYIEKLNELVMKKMGLGNLLKEKVIQVAQNGVLPGMDPMAAMQMQQGGFGQPMAQPPNAMPGGPIMPDAATLAASPNGAGATPAPSGGGPYLPSQGMQAGVQSMGPGG